MTAKEAIEILKKDYCCNRIVCELYSAKKCQKNKCEIWMAISALQAQEAKTQLSGECTTSDYISRQAAIDVIDCSGLNLDDPEENWMMQDRIRELPSAQPERKKGKWMLYDKHDGFPEWKCSECDGNGRGDYFYCPWCNADMRGDSDGSD